MNRHFLILSVLSLSALAGALACSGAPTGPVAADETPDSAVPGQVSANPADAGLDLADAASPGTAPPTTVNADAASTQTSAPDAATPAPTGTLLVAGPGLELDGITDDGFVVYSQAGNVLATPLAGGSAVLVEGNHARPGVAVSGSAVFTWSVPLLANLGSELDVWTSTQPLTRLTTSALGAAPIATNAGGTQAAFFTRAGLVVSNLDGTRPHSLGPVCASALTFDAVGDLVTTNCAASLDDAGAASSTANLSVFAAPAFGRSLLTADTAFQIDPTGSWIWVVDDDAGGKLIRATDGSIAFSDVLVSGSAFFDATGTTLFYLANGAIKSLALASPTSATTLVASEVGSLLALSPDGKQLVYAGFAGVFVQPTTALLPATQIDSFPSAAYAFTSDSAAVASMQSVGRGQSRYVVESVHPTVTQAIGIASSLTVLAGSRVLVVDGSRDGQLLDATGKTPPVDVPGMGPFVVSPDLTHVVYTAAGAQPGLYVVSTLTEGAAGTGSQLH